MSKKKIVIVQSILPHYRASFFDRLCSDNLHDFYVLSGSEQSDIKQYSPANSKVIVGLKNYRLKLFGHSFLFQINLFSSLKALRPTDIVFGGPDIHIISSLLAFVYYKFFTRTKVHWWTHGIKNSYSIIGRLQAFFIRQSNSVLTYEKKGRDSVIKFIGYPESNIDHVGNALNDSDYGLANVPDWEHRVLSLKKENNKLHILFSGRLTRDKRLEVLLDAAEILQRKGIDFQMDIVGGGDLIEFYQNRTHAASRPSIVFHGPMYESALTDLFLRADVFVLPGKVGLSVIHALSYGLPVITTMDDIHSPEVAVLEDGVNGLFFRGTDDLDLAGKIIQMKTMIQKSYIKTKRQIYMDLELSGYVPQAMVNKFVLHFNSI